MTIPVILDTDIGGDIDDTWALALLLRCPELDLRLVTSATGNTEFRARLLCKLLQVAGRTDVTVGVGIRESDGDANQGAWIDGYALADYPGPLHSDGVGAMIDTVMGSSEPITVISIAPSTNIAEALRREPRIAERCHFVVMGGSLAFGVEGVPGAVAECNIVTNTAASQEVFAAPWLSMTITPLDSCGLVVLRGDKYKQIEASAVPLTRAVLENYDAWWSGHPVGRTTVLFDTVAVFLAFSQQWLHMETLGIRITDDGFTQIDPSVRRVLVATEWTDLSAFEDFLVERFTHL